MAAPTSSRVKRRPPPRSRPREAAETHPAFLLREFLESDEARPIRILAEYHEPLRRFRDQQIQDTVVFFGSARVHSRQWAQKRLARARLVGPRPTATADLDSWQRAVH